jgi:hypothetical protein
METPFDPVRIILTSADGRTLTTAVMHRWWAEWLMANEIASGYYKGVRIASARILTV